MPRTGPPKSWLLEHGRTPNCNACSYDKLHGRTHNKKCKQRYLDWLSVERAKYQSRQDNLVPPESSEARDRNSSSTSSAPIPSALPVEYQPPPRSRADDEASMPAPRRYTPSEAPSAQDVEDFADTDDMEVDLTSSFIDPVMHSRVFSQMFSESPEEHFERIGCLNSFYGRQSLLTPFYLPKMGEPTEFSEFNLNGSKVYLAYPKQVRSQGSLEQLDVEKAVKARVVELSALDKAKFGNIIGKQEAESFAKKHNLKIIGTRWVVGPKEIENADGKIEEAVRARLVVQEVASTNDAAYLGYSSSTPSGEAIRALLSHIATCRWHVATLDVGTAFMNAVLPPGVRAVIRLPSDISIDPNEHKPCYATLNRALNGLRCASRAWLSLASEICNSHGLKQCASESCVFMGKFTRGKFSSEVALVIYVDDVLVGCDNKDAIDEIRLAFLSRVEKIKVTGHLPLHQDGKVKFLGREITRQKGSDDLRMRVPVDYLYDCVKDLTSTPIPPKLDLDEKDSEVLTPESASRYRSILGRVAWWGQSNSHLLRFMSMLATGQATPTHKHERALFRTLRFIKSQLHLHQIFQSNPHHRIGEGSSETSLELYCDASWGSPSVSGYIVFWRGNMLKSVSRVQQSIALSACEAELVSCAQGCQESLGITHLVGFFEGSQEKPMHFHGTGLLQCRRRGTSKKYIQHSY